MKRIITVLAAMALMAAMLVAMAMPAFADKGGGHYTKTPTNDGDCRTSECQFSYTNAEGSSQPGVNGRQSGDGATLSNGDTYYYSAEGTQTGGGKGIGGGNCTFTYDLQSGEETTETTGGNGSRCR